GLSGGPWYVVRKNVRDNVVYVSNGYDTRRQYGRTVPVEEMHWITEDPFASKPDNCEAIPVAFKTRHSPEFTDGTLRRLADGGYSVESATDVQGIAPGQYAIIYTPDRRLCLGSGMISLPPGRKNKKKNGEN
nr:hypothetical protein [Muribaculaceae bacterium]